MLQFGASLTANASSVNYDRNMFIIQATEVVKFLSSLIDSEVYCSYAQIIFTVVKAGQGGLYKEATAA